MVIKAYVDIQNLAELLNVRPDLVDAPDALPLTLSSTSGVAIEFQNVSFHYPSQHYSSGLKGVSFKVEPNTTTALVGSTGT